MSAIINFTAVGFLLFVATGVVNPTSSNSGHYGQHVTHTTTTANKTSVEQKDPSPLPNGHSHQHHRHSTTTINTSSASVTRGGGRKFGSSDSTTAENSRWGTESSRETITEVKRSADEFEFQLEPPDPPVSLASSSTNRYMGPYFESNRSTLHVTARAGQTVTFDCTVALLQGRTVSWLRRRKDNLYLLTVGNATYSPDSRVGLRFRYPNNWRLGIEPVQKGDEGEYQCQLSTHPPKALIFHLKVIAPAVQILDENGHVVTERHYKVDSSLHLTCKASHVDKLLDNIIWLKGERPLPGGDSRIKVKVTKNANGVAGEATGYLSVLSVRKKDSGNYTCRAGTSSLAFSTISVHVLDNGELPAAVQHENGGESCSRNGGLWIPLISATLHTLLHIH